MLGVKETNGGSSKRRCECDGCRYTLVSCSCQALEVIYSPKITRFKVLCTLNTVNTWLLYLAIPGIECRHLFLALFHDVWLQL